MSQSASSSRRYYPTRQFPLDLSTYSHLKALLGTHDIDIDHFLSTVRNDRGYVQLELNYQAMSASTQLSDHVKESLSPVFKSDDFVLMIGKWITLAKMDKSFLVVKHADVRTKLAAKLGGQHFLTLLDKFQKVATATIQRMDSLFAVYKADLDRRSELATEIVKFTDEWLIGHKLSLFVIETRLKAIADAIVSIEKYYCEQHTPDGVKLINLLSESNALQCMHTIKLLKESIKRASIIGNVTTMHAIRLNEQSHRLESSSTPANDRMSGTPVEQAYLILKHALANLNLDVDNFLVDCRSLNHSDIEGALSEFQYALEEKITDTISLPYKLLASVKQKWTDTINENPSISTMEEIHMVGHEVFRQHETIDSCVTFILTMLRGYIELMKESSNRFDELVKLLYRYRADLLIHNEIEYLTTFTMHGVYIRIINSTLRWLSDDLVPSICLQFALTKDTQSKINQFIKDFNDVWRGRKSVRAQSLAAYRRYKTEREQENLLRTRVSEVKLATTTTLPTPVSYPKSDPSKDDANVTRQHRLTKKVKTRGISAAAASLSSESSSSSSSSSSSDDDDGDDDDDDEPRLDKNNAMEALREYYKQQNPTWKAKLIRAAAKNEWWARQKREEHRKNEIEDMRQLVTNLNTVDELPSFTTHPPNLPHPRSFAAMSASQPSIASSSSSSSSSVTRHRPNQPMSLDQFWAWQTEKARDRAAELRTHKRKQHRQQSKRK